MPYNYRLWDLTSLNTDCCLLTLSVTVHGCIHIGGTSTLKMEAEFSLKSRQNIQDCPVSSTDDDSTSLTSTYSEGIRKQTAENTQRRSEGEIKKRRN